MDTLAELIKKKALELGFETAGITHSEILEQAAADLHQMITEGKHGSMQWLAKTERQRPDPRAFFPDAKSVLMVAHNYYRQKDVRPIPPYSGIISLYARGRDYHKVLRKKLKRLLAEIQEREPTARGRIFVDSFPIMEKPLAVRAGIGWIGKNTTLLLKQKGSFFFLGGIILNLPLPADKPFTENYCGRCNRCQQACPTNALEIPGQLDSRRCISYLTIEHEGAIPEEFHPGMGTHIFGCDICQLVCPWNRFAQDTTETDFFSRFHDSDLKLTLLARLSQKQFERMFEGTPFRRVGYENFKRNVTIAQMNMRRLIAE
ncbi:MAG: tRNA epoxyqueuosine(34) reductase QueG [Calditrichia bacterium]